MLPVYDYCGLKENKAPALVCGTEKLVTPDLLIAKDKRSLWMEIKYKTSASFTLITGQEETGINARLWRHYVQVSKITGLPVYIMFLHEKENSVRVGPLHELIKIYRWYTGSKMGREGMFFFPFEQLKEVCCLNELLECAENND